MQSINPSEDRFYKIDFLEDAYDYFFYSAELFIYLRTDVNRLLNLIFHTIARFVINLFLLSLCCLFIKVNSS